MAFPLDDIVLGPQSFGRLHRLDGIILHTGEEPGFGRSYALATAQWQRTNPGSYSFRIYDRRSDPRGVMLNVPWLEASGGINPSSTAWAPDRFPFLRTGLPTTCPVAACPGPYRNPTMHHLQVSFVGRTSALNAGQAPTNYLSDAKALVAWAETHPLRGPKPLLLSMHAHWQNNRSDCGAWMYSRLTPQENDLMPDLSTLQPAVTAVVRAGASGRSSPSFNPAAYGENVVVVLSSQTTLGFFGWVPGTNVTLADGTIVSEGKRWAALHNRSRGALFYHESDILSTSADGLAQLQDALDSANTRTATVKTAGAAALRKAAATEEAHAASLETAATNLEKL